MIEQIYDTICETNDKLLLEGEKIAAVCFFIKGKESKAVPINMAEKHRERVQLMLKGVAVKTGVDGYIIVTDTNTSHRNKKTGNTRTGTCIIRTLYTSTRKITELAWYEDNKITLKQRYEGRSHVRDSWDAWNEAGIEILKK